jgi:hypothetical protein
MEQKKTKKSKKIEEVLEPIKQIPNDVTVEEKPKKSRAKKTETLEVVETSEEKPKKSRAKKTETLEVVETSEEKPKKTRAKKTETLEVVETSEEKPKKSRAKKTETLEVVETSEEKPKKTRAKKTETKETTPDVVEEKSKKLITDETKDCYIQQFEIDELLLFAQKCKESIVSHYDMIINNISTMQKNVNSIDIIRGTTNNVYKNMFDILSNNNLLISHIHNLHTNFVKAANSKLSKDQYLEITKECCANIDKLRETYINTAEYHNESLTKLYVQLNDFLESLQNSNSNFKLDKIVKNVIDSDSENSDTSSDKLDGKKSIKLNKALKLEKTIIKSDSDTE